MPNVSVHQTSFAGGELAPSLYARSDINRYAIGLRRCLNFFVGQHGSLLNRPGLKHVREIKNSSQPVRLIPFIFSAAESYVLEFGNQYVRFHQLGAVVADGAGVPREVVTPYLTADLPRLKYTQLGNVMTIVHPNYPPAELTRVTTINWTYNTISFSPPTLSQWYLGSVIPFGSGLPTMELKSEIQDTTHPAKEWDWVVTQLLEDSSGKVFETFSQTVFGVLWSSSATYAIGDTVTYNSGTGEGYHYYVSKTAGNLSHAPYAAGAVDTTNWQQGLLLFTDKPRKIFWSTFTKPVGYTLHGIVVYRGRNGLYGFVGSTAANANSFNDDGITPDYSIQPPKGTNPFAAINDGAGAQVHAAQYPGCVSFFEQRRIFARTDVNPQTLYMSATGEFTNYDLPDIVIDSSPIEATVASQQLEEIRSLVSHRAMLLMTSSGEWSVGGSGGPITPSNVNARLHSRRGSNYLDPLIIGNAIIYAQDKGNSVRDLIFDLQSDSYTGNELTLLAQHLFPTTTDIGFVSTGPVVHSGGRSYSGSIVSWAYADIPFSVIWMVRSDGVLLGLTYNREQEILAWHQHTTDGLFEDVCVIPEDGEDAAYFVVNRTINGVTRRFVERMASRRAVADRNLCCFLDASQSFDFSGFGGPQTLVLLNTPLQGKTVYGLLDGNVVGPMVVASNNVVTFPAGVTASSYATIGLPYTSEIELLDVVVPGTEARTKLKNVWKAVLEVLDTRGIQGGETFSTLHEILPRQVADQYGSIPLYTGMAEVGITQTMNKGGRIVLRQTDPLPACILGVTREISLGGD